MKNQMKYSAGIIACLMILTVLLVTNNYKYLVDNATRRPIVAMDRETEPPRQANYLAGRTTAQQWSMLKAEAMRSLKLPSLPRDGDTSEPGATVTVPEELLRQIANKTDEDLGDLDATSERSYAYYRKLAIRRPMPPTAHDTLRYGVDRYASIVRVTPRVSASAVADGSGTRARSRYNGGVPNYLNYAVQVRDDNRSLRPSASKRDGQKRVAFFFNETQRRDVVNASAASRFSLQRLNVGSSGSNKGRVLMNADVTAAAHAQHVDADRRKSADALRMADPDVHSERWVVVTSINRPTKDISRLASMPDWKVVIVGDKKTPANWSHPNCIYLSPERQKSLGYGILERLPWKQLFPKEGGYLYAIQHGAKFIFDTDDDNHPTDNLASFVYEPRMTGLVAGQDKGGSASSFTNPYAHFGQPTIWPRGYPLNKIGLSRTPKYVVCEFKTPAIQQGIVNGDPDVDAMFRLTRKNVGERLNLTFDGTAPPVVLSPGTFSPFNSQNTLFHRAAFWGLLLPVTTTSRVCDIWRGYSTQRLLWETGGHLAFFGPTSFQHRNSHSYMTDAADENDLYHRSNQLVDLLRHYRCTADDLYACMIELTDEMVRHDLLQIEDALLARAWIDDLRRVGYTPPATLRKAAAAAAAADDNDDEKEAVLATLRRGGNDDEEAVFARTCSHEEINGAELQFEPIPQPTSLVHAPTPTRVLQNEAAIAALQRDICPTFVRRPLSAASSAAVSSAATASATDLLFDDILLVVLFNDNHADVIPLLEVMYRPNFPNILYCGEFLPDTHNRTVFGDVKYSFYAIPNIGPHGHYGYECMMGAVRMRYNVSGYLLINDDVRMNIRQWANFNRSAMIFEDASRQVADVRLGKLCRWHANDDTCDISHKHKWLRIYRKQLTRTLDRLKSAPSTSVLNRCYRNLVALNKGEYRVNYKVSDVYYIPRRLADDFAALATVFRDEVVFVGLAVPTIMRCLDERESLQKVKHMFLWGPNRTDDAPWTRWEESLRYHAFHPYKLSSLLARDPLQIQHFCTQVLPEFASCRPAYWP
ncbi:PREDICTED: uncharacterized protein LOC106804670 [Priapulus caudatus]|uniref:Uncharacterized protein LOC106804670 n=1 Tax=Priapulus caudatus TaxID=37621 RepID=A0ABM1DNB0_PRICU|nr:PREDICTED: uncharacterized protein LOC106804670 [Priapulus caudatus]